MNDKKYFPLSEYKVLKSLMEDSDNVSVRELSRRLGIDQSFVAAAGLVLSEQGLLSVKESSRTEILVKDNGIRYAEMGLPEKIIVKVLNENGGELEIRDISTQCSLNPREVGSTLKWLTIRGWAEKNKGFLKLTAKGKDALSTEGDDERLLKILREKNIIGLKDLEKHGISFENSMKYLKKREGILSIRERREKYLSLTGLGKETCKQGISPREPVTQLTSELLISGKWREMDIQKYDVSMESPPVYPGKAHPFNRIQEETRKVFLSMGFTEVTTSYVESSFWNFDALFTPQDHPAREMQDTFYLKTPSFATVPDDELLDRIRETHETGGDTGSKGWGAKWDETRARNVTLRTHTTAATIRALAANPRGPGKFFCIGPVFRRETVDYKHLPTFVQIDGIIVEETASFANLLGTLAEFYTKMGFEKFQFRPGFFPYTEPSVEVFVWNPGKKDWVEMGGAGIFRSEVTIPLGCTDPVLAWGLGLERIAMFKYGLDSIREVYSLELNWLQEVPLCL